MARSRVRTHERRLLVGGRGCHVGARPCTEGEGLLDGTVAFHWNQVDSNQHGVARTCLKRTFCASSRERARVGAFACAHTRTPASRTRPQLARPGTPVHRGKGPPRCRIRRPWGVSRLQSARRGAHTLRARVLRLLPRESARWRVCVCAHANAGCFLEAAAGTSEHGRAPRERAFWLARWPSIEYGSTLTSAAQLLLIGHRTAPISAARRAHDASARAAPPPERECAVARLRVRTRERRLNVGGRGWHVGALSCTEREGLLNGTIAVQWT